MKKLVILGLVLAGASAMYAQGTVSLVSDKTSIVTFGDMIKGGDTYVKGDKVPGGPTGFTASIIYEGNSIGTAPFGITTKGVNKGNVAGTEVVTINTIAGGSTIDLLVQAYDAEWTTTGGVTGYYGESSKFSYVTGNPTAVPPTTAGAMTFTPFEVNYVIPEPTTIALGLIGLTGLLFIRRRH